jgi:hypothetical protein
MREVVKK